MKGKVEGREVDQKTEIPWGLRFSSNIRKRTCVGQSSSFRPGRPPVCSALEHPPSPHSRSGSAREAGVFPPVCCSPVRSGLADSGDGGNMSVAFAAPRQRGKGEITPAAIQKVKPRGDGDARPIPPLGEPRGPGRQSVGPGAEAGLLGGGGVATRATGCA